MPGFNGLAVWGVNKILYAETDDAAFAQAQVLFDGISRDEVVRMRADPKCVQFSEDGNSFELAHEELPFTVAAGKYHERDRMAFDDARPNQDWSK